MTYVCDKCGARVAPERVLPPLFTLDAVNKLRAAMRAVKPERPNPPLTEDEYKPDLAHGVSSFHRGRTSVGRCGPLREANAQDEWLWRIGAVREGGERA